MLGRVVKCEMSLVGQRFGILRRKIANCHPRVTRMVLFGVVKHPLGPRFVEIDVENDSSRAQMSHLAVLKGILGDIG